MPPWKPRGSRDIGQQKSQPANCELLHAVSSAIAVPRSQDGGRNSPFPAMCVCALLHPCMPTSAWGTICALEAIRQQLSFRGTADSRVQLEGCSPAVLKSRAMDLRDALGGVAASPLPSGSAAVTTRVTFSLPRTQQRLVCIMQLISWILEAQASAPEVDPSHGEQKTTVGSTCLHTPTHNVCTRHLRTRVSVTEGT